MSTISKPRRASRRASELTPPAPGVEPDADAGEDQVLYWPACGHPEGDDVVLYDRPVCVACED